MTLSQLAPYAAAVLTVTNAVSFFLMWADKRAAKRGAWRVPEKTLFASALCFGGLGGVVGMHLFHHKTRHWYFRYGLPAIFAAQLALGVYLKFFR